MSLVCWADFLKVDDFFESAASFKVMNRRCICNSLLKVHCYSLQNSSFFKHVQLTCCAATQSLSVILAVNWIA